MGLEYDLPKQMCSSSSREEKSRLFMFCSEWWETIRLTAWSQYTPTAQLHLFVLHVRTSSVSDRVVIEGKVKVTYMARQTEVLETHASKQG